jgi:hypothetical protein
LVDFEADISIAAFNAFTDLLLIAIGLLVITNLKLRLHTKIALCVILSLSSLYAPQPSSSTGIACGSLTYTNRAMVAAILKTIQLQLMNSSSFSCMYALPLYL